MLKHFIALLSSSSFFNSLVVRVRKEFVNSSSARSDCEVKGQNSKTSVITKDKKCKWIYEIKVPFHKHTDYVEIFYCVVAVVLKLICCKTFAKIKLNDISRKSTYLLGNQNDRDSWSWICYTSDFIFTRLGNIFAPFAHTLLKRYMVEVSPW